MCNLLRIKHLQPFSRFPARSRRRQESGPAQGPPGTQSVAGPRTLRFFVGPAVPCQPRSSCRLLRKLRRPQLPLRSPRGGVGNIRGRKVQPRRAAVLLDRHLPHSASVQCGHPAALRSSAAGSLSLRKPGSRTSRQPRLLRSAPRYGYAVVKPACYSSRDCKPPSTEVTVRF